jgi:signal peptidase II
VSDPPTPIAAPLAQAESIQAGPWPPGARRRRLLLCFGIAAALVALDLWSKAEVFALLDRAQLERTPDGYDRYALVGSWLGFMKNLNYGAAFGQGAGFPWVLVPLRGVALIVVSVLIVRAPRGQRAYISALVLILAGAAGNLYDNLFNGDLFEDPERPFGPVRDFIDVYFSVWDWHFATFNVADSCISCGAVLLVLSGMGGGNKDGDRTDEGDAPEPTDASQPGE